MAGASSEGWESAGYEVRASGVMPLHAYAYGWSQRCDRDPACTCTGVSVSGAVFARPRRTTMMIPYEGASASAVRVTKHRAPGRAR